MQYNTFFSAKLRRNWFYFYSTSRDYGQVQNEWFALPTSGAQASKNSNKPLFPFLLRIKQQGRSEQTKIDGIRRIQKNEANNKETKYKKDAGLGQNTHVHTPASIVSLSSVASRSFKERKCYEQNKERLRGGGKVVRTAGVQRLHLVLLASTRWNTKLRAIHSESFQTGLVYTYIKTLCPSIYGQLMELNLPHDAFIYRAWACNLPGEDRIEAERRTMLAQSGKKVVEESVVNQWRNIAGTHEKYKKKRGILTQ